MARLPPKVNELSWMIGGPQGSGVDSSANAFTRACAHGGLNVFGKREYYSNIMGRHSYFSLRASRGIVRSHIDDVELLTTFDAETVFRHTTEVVDGGAVICDPALAGTKVSDVDTISRRNAAEIRAQLAALANDPPSGYAPRCRCRDARPGSSSAPHVAKRGARVILGTPWRAACSVLPSFAT